MANLKCKCGCEVFYQNEITCVSWSISEDGVWEEKERELVEVDGNIVCSNCNEEYYYDGEELITLDDEEVNDD